jgi:3-hydroxyacyl-[acyl-carrier-protein] dehydratase
MRFIFIDKILEFEKGKRALILKNVSHSEDFFSLHFPGFPVMPGALMLEALEQASTIFLSLSSDFKLYGSLREMKNAKFRRIVRPGDQLLVEVKLKSSDEDSATIAGKIMVDDKRTVTVDLLFALMEDTNPQVKQTLAKMKSFYKMLSQDVHAIFS